MTAIPSRPASRWLATVAAAGLLGLGLTGATAAPGDQADLRVEVTQSASRVNLASADSTVAYTVDVLNTGPTTATGVTMTDVIGDKSGAAPLPAPLNLTPTQGAAVVSVAPSQGICTVDSGVRGYPQTVTCALGSLASSAGATITIVVQPRLNTFVALQPSGAIVNTVNVTSDATVSYDPDLTDNTVQVVTEVAWYGLVAGNAEVNEGAPGDGNTLEFIVYVDGQPTSDITVAYSTSDGTATTAGGDYTPVSGTLTFPLGGPNFQYVSVPVGGDTTIEGDETLTLDLASATPTDTAYRYGPSATGTIYNDD